MVLTQSALTGSKQRGPLERCCLAYLRHLKFLVNKCKYVWKQFNELTFNLNTVGQNPAHACAGVKLLPQEKQIVKSHKYMMIWKSSKRDWSQCVSV